MTPVTTLLSALVFTALPQDEWWPLEPGEVSHWEFEWSDVFTGVKDLSRDAQGTFVDRVLREGDAGFECLRLLEYTHKSGSGGRQSDLQDASHVQYFDGERREAFQTRRTLNGRGAPNPMVCIPYSLYPGLDRATLKLDRTVVREAALGEQTIAILYGDRIAFRETLVEGEDDDAGLWVLQRRLDSNEALRTEHPALGTYLLHAYDVDYLFDPDNGSVVGYRRHINMDGWAEEGKVAFRTIRMELREVDRQIPDDDHWSALVDETDAWWSVREAASVDADSGLELLNRYRVSRGELLLPVVADALAGEIRRSEEGRMAYARRQAILRGLLGNKVPEIELEVLHPGDPASLHELIDGKVAYLTFWGVG